MSRENCQIKRKKNKTSGSVAAWSHPRLMNTMPGTKIALQSLFSLMNEYFEGSDNANSLNEEKNLREDTTSILFFLTKMQ